MTSKIKLILYIFLFSLSTLGLVNHAHAAWYNASWTYRKKVTVAGQTGAGTNYQVKLLIGQSSGSTGANFHLENHIKTDFSDLRFTASDETTLLDYWIESISSTSPNQTATVWVEVAADLGSNKDIYAYYGNAGASSASNGSSTFLFFDDFSGDLSKWTIDAENTDKVTISSGALRHDPDSTQTKNAYFDTRIRTASFQMSDGAVDYKVYEAGTANRKIHQFGWRASGLTFGSGYAWRMQNSAADGGFFEFAANNWTPIGTAYAAVSADAWHNVEVRAIGQNMETFVNGSSVKTVTDNTTAGPGYLTSHLHGLSLGGSDYVLVDDVRVRKIVATEPAYSSANGEESGVSKQVYYSVGQSTADLQTGTSTVTISGATGLATFSTAQTGNIGVGDRLTVATNTIYYISSKASSSAWYVVTATGALPAATTSALVTSIKREYTSLAAAEAGATDANHLNTADLVAGSYQLNFPCYYDSGPDTTEVTVSGYTTGVNNYIKIYTPSNTATEANNSQRHSGKWDDGKYNLRLLANWAARVYISDDYVRLDGLQVYSNPALGSDDAIAVDNTAQSNQSEIRISNTVIAKSAGSGIFAGSGKVTIWNSVIHDAAGAGVYIGWNANNPTVFIYNSTIVDNGGDGIYQASHEAVTIKNVIASGNGDSDYNVTGDGFNAASSTNNISFDGTALGMNAKASTTVQFADPANHDYHLSPNDTAAKNAGADLSADANFAFNTDIDGQTRTGSWDIGADEGATAVYYSVGQNTSDHKTGSPTVTVSSSTGLATFSVSQTAANMGVGDVITYGSNKCYITAKASTTAWYCATATGTTPVATTSATVTSISHSFSSLNAALPFGAGGAKGASYLNSTDLVTGNYQLNIPCYYDSGPDTAAVSISGWTTGPSNYIRVYAPSSATTEVNASQRHQGKWDDSKYKLEISGMNDFNTPLGITSAYTKVDGLQISFGGTTGGLGPVGIFVNSNQSSNPTPYIISNNIIKGTQSMHYAGIYVYDDTNNGVLYASNNIIYDTNYGIGYHVYGNPGLAYLYNNTIYNASTSCVYANYPDTTIVAKNNIVQSCGTGFGGGGVVSASSSNNISQDASSPNASLRNKTVSFADAANRDFHLAASSTARDAGIDLSADVNFAFNTDFDGQTRPSSANAAWDIGADEGATAVYYSVGQNTTDHKTGSPTVTVSSSTGLATFSVAQTATNMGVGDVITYGTTNKCYITSKASTTSWYCATATGTAPVAATNATVNSIAHAFSSLNAAVTGALGASYLNTSDLIAGNYQLNFPAYYDSGPDTAQASVITYTTGPANFVRIYTPDNTQAEVNQGQRHGGRWDDNKYNLSVSGSSYPLYLSASYVRVDGLQVAMIRNTTSAGATGAILNAVNKYSADIRISNNIVKGIFSGTAANFKGINNNYAATPVTIWNNIVYDFNIPGDSTTYGIGLASGAWSRVYNNTVYNCYYGINSQGGGADVKNNVVQNSVSDYFGTFSASSTNNISQDATSPNASLRNKAVSFSNSVNKDFHLSPSDAAAKNAGADLSADANFAFSTDIDGQARSGVWDIGADEAVNVVYYSVGQSTADQQTGTSTVTIASGTATFSTAQAGNIGVGDRLTIATSTVVYISGKISQTQWNVVTATGTMPAATTSAPVTSIKREYTSLSAALAGASDANHLSTSDLVATNVQLNFPAYYDSGPDTTRLTVTGYTTAANNYIKIYTPNNAATEANFSQRHQGKWDDNKYRMDISYLYDNSLTLRVANAVVEGIQVRSIRDQYTGYSSIIINNPASEVTVSDNIVRGEFTGTAGGNGIDVYFLSNPKKIAIHNNIVYDIINGGFAAFGIYNAASSNVYLYNNTIVNCGVAINVDYNPTAFVAKNNIIQNCKTGFTGSGGGALSAGSDYNISNDTTVLSPSYRSGQATIVKFADALGKDFHLSPADTAAKNAGADLSADSNSAITTDIDGQARPTGANIADIGADEGATAVYYSVGQNTSDHKTGAPTVTIASGTATFSTAQTATNMGVGDKVTYNTSSIAYISEKISATQWKLVTATGSMPANVSGQIVNSIAHEFSSIDAALPFGAGGAKDSSHLNTTDLAVGNYQLNIPLYYDSGVENAGQTPVYGWITSPQNYIRIYTPFNISTEVNQSQRHSGKWDSTKYSLVFTATASYRAALYVSGANFVKIDGLQISVNPNGYGGAVGISAAYLGSGSKISVSNNIISKTGTDDSAGSGIEFSGYGYVDGYAYNNVIYGFRSAAGYGYGIKADNKGGAYLYNNTVHDCGRGIIQSGISIAVVKNNLTNANAIDYLGTYDASSINNISQDATSPNVALRNKTVSFVDAANKNFHLSSTDTAARKAGIGLQNDPYLHFSNDIDGQERAGSWDIGADEFREVVTHSQNASPNLDAGLVGHWTFDAKDVNGNVANDTSGNNNNGTIFSATPMMGKLGQGMNFNGNGENVSTEEVGVLDGATAASVCFWLKYDPASVTSDGAVASTYPPGFMVWVDDVGADSGRQNTMSFVIRSGVDIQVEGSANLITPKQWDHYCATFSGGAYERIYKNGIMDTQRTTSIPAQITDNVNNMVIGRQLGSRFLDSALDDVRVYDRALSDQEIGMLYHQGADTVAAPEASKGDANGLVGYWSFDGPSISSGQALDLSGNGNNGTIFGATPAMGKIGQGMKFNGTSDYVEKNSPINIPATNNPMTVSLWAKSNVDNGGGRLLDLHDSNNLQNVTLYIYPYGSKSAFKVAGYSDRTLVETSASPINNTFPANAWIHYVYTFDGTTHRIYRNAALDNSSNTAPDTGNPNKIGIGRREVASSGTYFNGSIDEVRIYNRALSVQEINGLYGAGKVQIRK